MRSLLSAVLAIAALATPARALTHSVYGTTGQTVYALVWRAGDSKVWNAATGAWVTFAGGSIADYDFPATEIGTMGIYTATLPDDLPHGECVIVEWRTQAGGAPAQSDARIEALDWSVDLYGNGLNNSGPANRLLPAAAAAAVGRPFPMDVTSIGGLPVGFGDGIGAELSSRSLAIASGQTGTNITFANRSFNLASTSGNSRFWRAAAEIDETKPWAIDAKINCGNFPASSVLVIGLMTAVANPSDVSADLIMIGGTEEFSGTAAACQLGFMLYSDASANISVAQYYVTGGGSFWVVQKLTSVEPLTDRRRLTIAYHPVLNAGLLSIDGALVAEIKADEIVAGTYYPGLAYKGAIFSAGVTDFAALGTGYAGENLIATAAEINTAVEAGQVGTDADAAKTAAVAVQADVANGVNISAIEGADPTDQIGDSVWDAAAANYNNAGSLGRYIADIYNDADDVFQMLDQGDLTWPAAWDAEIQSEVADGLTAYDAATGTDVSSAGVAADRGLRAPSSAFTFRVSRRADGTYTTDRPLRLRPGTTESVRVGLDMGRLAPNQYVATVGTPAVSGGSLTATDPERYDQLATFIVGGTATASEEQTIDVTVTMENGDVFAVTLPVEVFAD